MIGMPSWQRGKPERPDVRWVGRLGRRRRRIARESSGGSWLHLVLMVDLASWEIIGRPAAWRQDSIFVTSRNWSASKPCSRFATMTIASAGRLISGHFGTIFGPVARRRTTARRLFNFTIDDSLYFRPMFQYLATSRHLNPLPHAGCLTRPSNFAFSLS